MERRDFVRNIVGAVIALQVPKFIPVPVDKAILLPSTVGKAGQVLATDGRAIRWITGTLPEGGTLQMMHNEIWDGPIEHYIKNSSYIVTDENGEEVI